MSYPHEYRYLLSEDTVRRAVMHCAGPSQAHHYAHCEFPERQELFCFRSGAKLYRLGTHVWVIRGYDYDHADVERASHEFNDARLATRLSTTKETDE